MNFKGHIIAGSMVGLSSAFLANCFFHITPNTQATIIAIIVVFSLLPDLDIKSIPQKWFFRVVFGLLLYLSFIKQFQAATIIAICSISPLLGKHRGWTHSLWIALLMPAAFALCFAFITTNSDVMEFIQIENITDIIRTNIWFIASASIGWVTHIFVDKKY